MRLQESGEMYLEAIFVLSGKQTMVRSVDVSEYLGYSKPSVSRAVGLLKNGGYLTVDKKGSLLLTEEGLAVAENIYRRHTVLTTFLTTLGVDPMVASADACKLEHVISEETFEALCRYASERGLDT